MELIQKNWLSILMAVYFLGMALYGHYRGFFRSAFSIAAFLVSFLPVRLAMPPITAFIKNNTPVHSWLKEAMKEATGIQNSNFSLPIQQNALIERSPLPEAVKKVLIENNNEKIYQILGVDKFADYVSSFLADRIINTLVFVLLLLTIYIGIRVLAHGLDLISKIPILHGINQIAGAVLGLIEALAYFWVVSLILNIFVGTSWGQYLLNSIEETPWVFFLYQNNWLAKGLTGVIWNLL